MAELWVRINSLHSAKTLIYTGFPGISYIKTPNHLLGFTIYGTIYFLGSTIYERMFANGINGDKW